MIDIAALISQLDRSSEPIPMGLRLHRELLIEMVGGGYNPVSVIT
jgi:hypothetical protein